MLLTSGSNVLERENPADSFTFLVFKNIYLKCDSTEVARIVKMKNQDLAKPPHWGC